MQYYDIDVPSNGSQFQISAPGRYLRYLEGSAGGADATIKVRAGNSGEAFLLQPGQAIRLPASMASVDSWYLTNYSMTSPIAGKVLIGDGDFTDNRVSGSVEVIDGGKSRVMTGVSFLGSISIGGVAGDLPHVQLWNPANSGKRIILQGIAYTCSVDAKVNVRTKNAALASVGGFAAPKLIGSNSVTIATIQYTNAAAEDAGLTALKQGLVKASVDTVFAPAEPVIIPPGYGVHIVSLAAASVLDANFEYFEESVTA